MPQREQRVRSVWIRIEGWLRDHAPEIFEAMGEGASEEALAAAEETLELELPAELRHTLRRVDGIARAGGGGVLQSWELLSVEGIVQQYQGLMDLYERGAIPAEV